MKSMLKSLMSVAVVALAFTSCSNDATEDVMPNVGTKTLVVNASIDQTRTVMADNHVDLKWAKGDQIHLYIGETATQAQVIDNTIGEKITDVTYNGNENVYAYYSTKAGNKVSDGVKKVLLNIPSKQTQTKADVFAGEYMPMAASGTIQNSTVTLAFKPLACVLVFNVYGPAQNETIKSIKFETSVGCCGYDSNGCDLTVNPVQYKPYTTTSATVTLTEPAAIVAAKPDDTKPEGTQIGSGNQVYLVVAPVAYPAGSKFIVTTDAGSYTFTTKNGIDCSQNTARVVNLNLAKSPDYKKEIVVPDVPQQKSDGGELVINNIVFKHFSAEEVANAGAKVYADAELTQELDGADAWLTIIENTAPLAGGTLNCTLAANTTTASRTAYIGIKCGDVQEAIAVTQVAPGASTDKYYVKVTENLEDWTGDYLIVYENSDTEAYVWNLNDEVNGYITAKPSTLGILSNEDTDKCKVVISKSGEGYLLYATAGKNAGNYIFHKGSTKSNNKVYYGTQAEAEEKLNTIAIDSGSAVITSNTMKMRFNSNSNQMRFRYYGSGQKSVQLYKLQK